MVSRRVGAVAATVAAMAVSLLAGAIVLHSFQTIHTPLHQSLPQAVERLAVDSKLDALNEQIRLYDEVLTQSARNYAFTQDREWKARYLNAEPVLDRAIKEAIATGDSEVAAFFSKVDVANQTLVLMEHQAIGAVDDGRPADAQAALESNDYWHQKGLYAEALEDRANRRRMGAQADRKTAMDLLAQTVDHADAMAATGKSWALVAVAIGFAATAFACLLAIRLGSLGEQLERLSLEDPLTGLRNRRGFLSLGEHLLRIARRHKYDLHVVYADLNKMKWINDHQGHAAGDRALVEAAAVLRTSFRESDLIGRVGGDEFAVITVTSGGDTAWNPIERLQRNMEARNAKGDLPFTLSLAIGAVTCDPSVPRSLEALLTEADERMYEQKRTAAGQP